MLTLHSGNGIAGALPSNGVTCVWQVSGALHRCILRVGQLFFLSPLPAPTPPPSFLHLNNQPQLATRLPPCSCIVASMAPATGTRLSLVVEHGSTGARAVATEAWSFLAPVVTDVVPVGSRSEGRHLNEDFGLPCDGSVTTDPSSSSSSSGSSSSSSSLSSLTTSAAANNSACRKRWFPATASVFEVVGQNFGPDGAFAGAGGGISISVGGLPCLPLEGATVFVSDTLLRCAVSGASVGAKGVSLVVAGQVASVDPAVEVVALCEQGYHGSAGAGASQPFVLRP